MVTLSKAVQEAMWGDEAILRYMEMAREHFEKGERSALIETVYLCARFQAVMPDWAADALLDAQGRLNQGQLKDFNEAFGWDGPSQSMRERAARRARIEKDVLLELQNTRLDGASLSPDDMFDRVCDGLSKRGIEASRRDVEAIYKTSGQFVKGLPRSKDPMQIFGLGHSTIPLPRRTGRSILNDEKK
ncbi:hypothetical protein [Paraburkholderia sp. RL17-337-BIB-A]|uniref:hypothetical protein n=1 Tax=Paraburkholderia sp. RL17-337-BIB-A TaxID=3031636 RepID=UPI0038BD4239